MELSTFAQWQKATFKTHKTRFPNLELANVYLVLWRPQGPLSMVPAVQEGPDVDALQGGLFSLDSNTIFPNALENSTIGMAQLSATILLSHVPTPLVLGPIGILFGPDAMLHVVKPLPCIPGTIRRPQPSASRHFAIGEVPDVDSRVAIRTHAPHPVRFAIPCVSRVRGGATPKNVRRHHPLIHPLCGFRHLVGNEKLIPILVRC